MSISWPADLTERLCARQRGDGGWGYGAETATAPEATALAALALSTRPNGRERAIAALQCLLSRQQADGSVPAAANAPGGWTTAPALLAWSAIGLDPAAAHKAAMTRAAEWLLAARGRPAHQPSGVVAHNTELIGWSWAPATHSWIEPTATAVLALRWAGYDEHPRVREGLRLLLDRAMTTGGWNYGNTQVLGNTLRAFPETSGLALTALAGATGPTRAAPISAAIAFVERELPRIRAPLSLGWGLIGLSAWRARPAQAEQWLFEAATDALQRDFFAPHDALLLLALAPQAIVPESLKEFP